MAAEAEAPKASHPPATVCETAAISDATPSDTAAASHLGSKPTNAADVEMQDQPSAASQSRPTDDTGVVSEPAPVEEATHVPANPVTIGFRTFATGTECSDYFRSLLTQLSHEQDLNEYEFTMVMALLRKGHADPEGKIGSGVKAIQIKPHEEMDSICFFVHRTDGSKENFSYRKCIGRLFKDFKDTKDSDRSSKGRGRGRSGPGRGGGRGRGRGRGGRSGGRGRGRK